MPKPAISYLHETFLNLLGAANERQAIATRVAVEGATPERTRAWLKHSRALATSLSQFTDALDTAGCSDGVFLRELRAMHTDLLRTDAAVARGLPEPEAPTPKMPVAHDEAALQRARVDLHRQTSDALLAALALNNYLDRGLWLSTADSAHRAVAQLLTGSSSDASVACSCVLRTADCIRGHIDRRNYSNEYGRKGLVDAAAAYDVLAQCLARWEQS